MGKPRKVERSDVALARIRSKNIAHIADAVVRILRGAFFWGAAAFMTYEVRLAIDALSGRQTEFQGFMKLATDLRINEWVAYAVAASAGGGWWYERKARRKLIEEWGPYASRLEERIDPGRTSSGLSRKGDSR